MSSVHELLSEHFYRWEQRGRGWQVFDYPVAPEPPFVPFHFIPPQPRVDDGRKPTFLSSMVQRLSRSIAPGPNIESQLLLIADTEAKPEELNRRPCGELQISLPRDFAPTQHTFAQFIQSASLCAEPLSFELFGLPRRLVLQLAVAPYDSSRVQKQMEAFFPELTVLSRDNALPSASRGSSGS